MMGAEKAAQIIWHLLELLKDNRRLPVPAGCPVEVRPLPGPPGSRGSRRSSDIPVPCSQIYTLMLNCWSFTPAARPTFGELAPKIEALRDSRSKARG